MDFKKLSKAEQIIGGGGVVLLIASFLPWFKAEVKGLGLDVSSSASGWDYFLTGIVPTLIGLIMVAQIALTHFAPQVKLPELPWGKVHLGLGIAAAVLVILRLLIGEDGEGVVDISRQFGLFIATLASLALAVGGFLKSQEAAVPKAPPTAF